MRKEHKTDRFHTFIAIRKHLQHLRVCLLSAMKIYAINPKCGPSSGSTLIFLLGTGLSENPNLKVKFTFGANDEFNMEVEAKYDRKSKTISCKTPKFESPKQTDIKFPQLCKIYVSYDGLYYAECTEKFLIYGTFLSRPMH